MKLIFGGTFDPVHDGHIEMAKELVFRLKLNKIFLMPCFTAVHKDSVSATASERVKMLKMAVKNLPSIEVDEREIKRGKPSYTYDSLVELKSESYDEPITLVMGSDTALSLDSWYRVADMPELTNLVVLKRPKSSFNSYEEASSADLANKLESLGWRKINDLDAFKSCESGAFLMLDLSQYDLSSTQIRKAIRENNLSELSIADEVKSFICDNALYLQ